MFLNIIIIYMIAGFVDYFFKERTIQKLYKQGKTWSDAPQYLYQYPNKPTFLGMKIGWQIWIIFLYSILLLIGSYLISIKMLLGFICFYLEDFFYYFFTWIEFNLPMPDNLSWLAGNSKIMKTLVGEFPLSLFKKILFLQLIIVYFIISII